MSDSVLTVRELARWANDQSADALVAKLGVLALVGPAVAPGPDEAPGFRYATEHGPRGAGAPHPMTTLLESVVYGLVKRPGTAFASVLVIGRAPNSDVWIDDARVSKLHARVILEARGHVLCDAGSANGTFVDERRLADREEVVLTEGTKLRLGDRPFVVRHVATLHTMLRRLPSG